MAGIKDKQNAKQRPTLKTLMQKILVGLLVEHFAFLILVFGTTYLCTISFGANTDTKRKILNFTYSCLYAIPIKVV